ncbi:ATP synthase subunit d, mitochondrial [Gossypium hirsutum]|uniref:ATP synthase subunit d, mitochondrial n=1 Tax=Gossypium hirsutum TaxID=3635 RepID=A0ABM2ZXH5_GOSHI|nr:ATP synthase subunit d, mitochondrial-like [Gossypium hirsutum]
MSGPGKKVVDVAFKASKNIDWEGMAKLLVSDEARKEFATLRRTFDEVNSTLQTKFSQEPEPIDWEYYRKGIGSRLVDMYKEAYESVEIPKFVDTVTPQYKPKFHALVRINRIIDSLLPCLQVFSSNDVLFICGYSL